ncbi:hypothetical protein NE852_12820 [Rhizobium sp. Pop5]|uniref:hypothetical protein n=2 Tax=Rhizobium sp. Pop5 TaxID=1223565 RepID=UPI00028386E6|nr:hypothetical protein [Rhizobium sp. Pop5]EJZ17408.1 hypothetical protein RCCGEPOP_30919 [Rhizobium sp. Pop5]UVD59010.1 hypothetical protein NE852_12820 [Rhizobium sp. Pop5]
MMSVVVRIALRYLAAALVAKGVFSPDVGNLLSNDPDISMIVEIAAGAVIGLSAEAWYYLASRFGWAR